jgi:hypothetical protein
VAFRQLLQDHNDAGWFRRGGKFVCTQEELGQHHDEKVCEHIRTLLIKPGR